MRTSCYGKRRNGSAAQNSRFKQIFLNGRGILQVEVMNATNSPLMNAMDVIWHPHPVLIGADRKVISKEVAQGSTVREILLETGIDDRQSIIVLLDDRLLTVDEWDIICPKNGQLINVQAAASGGGGGDGGSNPLQIVALIAVVVLSVYTAGAVGAAYGAAWGAAAGAAISIAGSMVVNAIFKAVVPGTDTSSTSGVNSQSSPTYSITGGSNRSRPYESMPVVMGTMQFFPDMGAKPYTEFQGDDQYLYQIFNLGLSDLALSNWQIGTSPITDYTNYAWYGCDSQGRITSFPGNVDTISGGVLTNASGWMTRSSSTDSYKLGIDVITTLYYANNNGGLDSTSVSLTIQHRPTGTSSWINSTIENEVSNTVIISGASQSPIRKTYYIDVANGAYDVRILRNTADSTDSRTQNATTWDTLRSYQLDTSTYVGQNRIGLVIKASDQLNGTVQQLSVTAIANANYWNGSSWVYGQTSNPAHWFMDFSKGRFDSAGKLLYGVGMPDSQIDLDGLHSWAAFCDAESLSFNAVFDSTQTAADVLTTIARCGFASPSWATGKIGVVWDQRNASPVAAFGMSNILRGSFSVNYITEQLAEEVIVTYVNPANNWVQDQVRVIVPGVTSPSRSSSINLLGCTNQAMAGKFANYIAAQQYYRTRRIQWDCDFEGFVCQRGDVVLLSHDLTQWGYSGRVISHTGNTLTIDRTVPRSGKTDYLMLKKPDGTMTTYTVVSGSGDSNSLTLNVAPDFETGTLDMDHIWFFSPLPTPGKLVKILSVQPSSESRVTVVATDEDPEFYSAWDGTWNAAYSNTLLLNSTPMVNSATISELVYMGSDNNVLSLITVSFYASNFEKGDVKWRINGGAWNRLTTYTNQFDLTVDQTGSLDIQILPTSGTFAGSVFLQSFTVNGQPLIPPDVTAITELLIPTGIQLTWNQVPLPSLYDYEIRQGSSWGASSLVGYYKGSTVTLPPKSSGSYTYFIKARNNKNSESTNAAQVSVTIGTPATPTLNTSIIGQNYVLNWTIPLSTFPIDHYIISNGATLAAATQIAIAYSTQYQSAVTYGGSQTYWVAAVDVAGNIGGYASQSLTIPAPSSPSIASSFNGENYVLSWTNAITALPIDHYIIKSGATLALATDVAQSYTNQYQAPANFGGSNTFWVAGVDVAGNIGSYGQVQVLVIPPAPTVITAQVIDNNVLLYWTDSTRSLPVSSYEVRKGTDYNSAFVLGTKSGLFTTVFETAAGNYTYWITGIDSAGNYGTPSLVTALVNQPPDYILHSDLYSIFNGTKNNAITDSGSLILPIDTSSTFAAHFSTHGWNTLQDQINAGYPVYAQPSLSSGYYEELIDYGAVISSSNVAVNITSDVISGSPTLSTTISSSADGVTWIDYSNTTQAYLTNFRYVKYRVTVTSSDNLSIIRIDSLEFKLDVKLKNDAGNVNCLASDSGGTVVNFFVQFVDVISIQVTPKSTTPITAIYDFLDAPYPTSFKILLFNSSGIRVNGTVSWAAKGY